MVITPLRGNIQATLPGLARWPEFSLKMRRISAAARFFVIGGDFDQEGDTAGSVSLIEHFFKGSAAEFAGALLDGALDVINGDAFAAGGGQWPDEGGD